MSPVAPEVFLLDACAIVSWIDPHEETQQTVDLLDDLFLHCHRPDRPGLVVLAHNLAEVITTRQRAAEDPSAGLPLLNQLASLGVRIEDFPPRALRHLGTLARAEWELPQYPKQKLSLGDRLLLAAAVELGHPVLTSDQLWFGLPSAGLPVELVDYRSSAAV